MKQYKIENNQVISYSTHVANIDHNSKQVIELGRWSNTTTSHVKEVASQWGYTIVQHDNWTDYSKQVNKDWKAGKDTKSMDYQNGSPISFDQLEKATLRLETSRRGGGIEIDLEDFGFPVGAKMTAYQNYLGGGMLGSIQNDCNQTNWMNDNKLLQIAVQLKKYFHSLTNEEVEDWDEWAAGDYESIQRRPASAY